MVDRFVGIRSYTAADVEVGESAIVRFREASREGLSRRRLSGRLVGRPLIEMRAAGPNARERAKRTEQARSQRVSVHPVRASGC